MKELTSCKQAIDECEKNNRFAIAYLYHEEKTMNIHIHDSYEIYYSISGAKQFLISDKYYDMQPGDLFAINNYENHYVSQVDDTSHERYVISISPEFLQKLSSSDTNLSACFISQSGNRNHRIHLSKENHERFLYLIHKITSVMGFGTDLIETATFTELMVLINGLFQVYDEKDIAVGGYRNHEIVGKIIDYINQNITERITIPLLAEHFFLSESYICRLFKANTGTTINKYLTSRRISIAKAKLADGNSVGESCELSGFNDYTNFVQAFTKAVGMSPKKYGKCCNL